MTSIGGFERGGMHCAIYIVACALELDVLQDLIVMSLHDNEDWFMSDIFQLAAPKVYQTGQARMPFRQFFM